MNSVALIDYGSGNVRSVEQALWQAARRAGKRRDIRLTNDPDFIARAGAIVLPGVGAFAACMAALQARDGLIPALEAGVKAGAAFLGICVGMQLMADRGLEFGETAGLGWIPGAVEALRPGDPHLRVPHMGWNEVRPSVAHPVLRDLGEGRAFYFANSFTLRPADPATAVATTEHGERFVSIVGRHNLLGVQFHPEKSQAAGLDLLARFLEWRP